MNNSKSIKFRFLILLLLLTTAAIVLLFCGDAGPNASSLIIWELRVPKVVTAFLAGGLLAVSGLLMQIYFQNSLAGPDLLGINSGSMLGVAIGMMGYETFIANHFTLNPGWASFFIYLGPPVYAIVGALLVFLLILVALKAGMSTVHLIIVGLLISSFTSSLISLLFNFSSFLQMKNFLNWSTGTFQEVSLERLPLLATLSLLSLIPVIFLAPKLNLLRLGDNYAKSLGADVRQLKFMIVVVASVLVAVVTSFCGPIGFIGIIGPHFARDIFASGDLKIVVPASFLIGSMLAFICEGILVLPFGQYLTTNSILGLIGAPVVGFYLFRGSRFNA